MGGQEAKPMQNDSASALDAFLDWAAAHPTRAFVLVLMFFLALPLVLKVRRVSLWPQMFVSFHEWQEPPQELGTKQCIMPACRAVMLTHRRHGLVYYTCPKGCGTFTPNQDPEPEPSPELEDQLNR